MKTGERAIEVSYRIDDVFEIAEQIERNGAAFYRKAAEMADAEPARNLFLDLARQEEDHLSVFSEMRGRMAPKETEVGVGDEDDIVAIHLQALANRQVFDTARKPADVLSGDESVRDILEIAIGKECDSIIYYAAIRRLMRSRNEKLELDAIIREEHRHQEDLTAQLVALNE